MLRCPVVAAARPQSESKRKKLVSPSLDTIPLVLGERSPLGRGGHVQARRGLPFTPRRCGLGMGRQARDGAML